MDRSWIQIKNRHSAEYINGVESFMVVAHNHTDALKRTRCPCRSCNNVLLHHLEDVEYHLFHNGFARTYTKWVHHGEKEDPPIDIEDDEDSDMPEDEYGEHDAMQDILEDVYGGSFMHNFGGEAFPNNFAYDLGAEAYENYDSHDVDVELNKFARLLGDMQTELYPGCEKFSKLSFLIRLLHLKVINGWTNKSVDMLLDFCKDLLPSSATLPSSHYEARKLMRDLGLGYVSIHACINDCVLFWKDNEKSEQCPICGEHRYKNVKRGSKKKIPHKVLRYFPLKPRLQRLYMSRKTATHMRWHKEKRQDEEGVLRHPADSEVWKDFDKHHDWFARDPRNVRLALATDGFNPFGDMSNAYSMWPVILRIYNLPQWKCLEDVAFIMSMLIPGPRSPRKDIDIFLQPLIDELKQLWNEGVDTFDASKKKVFRLHAAVLWTINDFPAYSMLSGWSTKGYMACPPCNKDTSSYMLKHGRKICYPGHRRFLLQNHSWRRNRKSFDGKQELRSKPRELSGDDLLEQLSSVNDVIFRKGPNNKKRKRSPNEPNWTKKSIFFELPYWHTLKLRHNLDMMHIEKNVCDNIIGTLLDIEGKTKDTVKTRMDLKEMGIKKELHLIPHGDKFIMPHACYQLCVADKKCFYQWLKTVKFPDGYASNISRCVNVGDCKISGMKSHDCHVFLQRLLPVAIRGFVRKDVSEALSELSYFFSKLCSRTLRVSELEKMEQDIVIILCKLERIFPPAFFDVMVHLIVHLPREAILAGPVAFRWMFPIERFLHTLKTTVRNKARPEGSITEAYIDKECLIFCSMYFKGVETKFNREERNCDGSQRSKPTGLHVFTQNVRTLGAATLEMMPLKDLYKAQMFVLNNCEDVMPYLDEHKKHIQGKYITNVEQRHEHEFPRWFKNRMKQLYQQKAPEATEQLYILANGPDQRMVRYTGCIINGIRFHTSEREKHRKTQNSGVVVKGEHENKEIDFYGVLIDIVELNYIEGNKVYLFKCDWWDVDDKRIGIHSDANTKYVNFSRKWYKNDSYVLACQAHQVFYMKDPKLGGDWHVVQKVIPRNWYDVPELSLQHEDEDIDEDDTYETEDEEDVDLVVQYNDQDVDPLHMEDVEPEYVDPIVDPTHNAEVDQLDDDFVIDDDDTSEDDTLIDYCDDWEDEDEEEEEEEEEEILCTDNDTDGEID